MRHLLLATTLVCCGLQATAQSPQPQKALRIAAADGKKAYMQLGCYTCHGTVGQGGAGPSLAPNTVPLAALQQWVRNGTPGWSVASGMPAFSTSVLPDEELVDIRAYLASLPAPPAVKDIQILNR
jgi:ubiquinol-cytochrome c reductase cytochrome c subunit